MRPQSTIDTPCHSIGQLGRANSYVNHTIYENTNFLLYKLFFIKNNSLYIGTVFFFNFFIYINIFSIFYQKQLSLYRRKLYGIFFFNFFIYINFLVFFIRNNPLYIEESPTVFFFLTFTPNQSSIQIVLIYVYLIYFRVNSLNESWWP